MKRLFLIWFALTIAVGVAYAAPVDVNQARLCGQKFVFNSLGQKTAELSLAYTGVSKAGTAALYVFNFDHGYVVVAADDRAYPILGYSTSHSFDENNIPEGLRYYLGYYARQIQFAIDNELPLDVGIANQWYLVEKEGVMNQMRDGKSVSPLLTTRWNQDYPFNYYAPPCENDWNGYRCYAGCVACAMSQEMKYWNWPETGVGEHSYFSPKQNDTLSVNFGEATYNWAIMPDTLDPLNVDTAAKAVAFLMYHCGVAVDMDYGPWSSGAFTENVPDAVRQYFRYGECVYVGFRDSYSKEEWEDKLIVSLDRGIPLIYAGSDGEGGHAFNCDGYDSQRFFHFNWGWSGADNEYYQIDALNTTYYEFNMWQKAVFEMVPDYIYNAIVPAIETLSVEAADAHTKTAVVHFTAPTQSVAGINLESIQEIVLKRNGEVIQTFYDVQPGTQITFEDQLTEYGAYEYDVVGINNGIAGHPFSKVVVVGPNCTWKFMCQTTNLQGWNNGRLEFVGSNGTVFKKLTMTNSTPQTIKFQMPEGGFSMNWIPPTREVSSLMFNLKNSAGQTVYSFSGSSTQLEGTLYTGANDCAGCQPPTNFAGEYQYTEEGFGVMLTWAYDTNPQSFKVYRSTDGVDYELVATVDKEARQYFDMVPAAEYYYKVTAYRSACESTPAFTADDVDYVYVVMAAVGENDDNVRIFPNPAKDKLSIQANDINEVTLFNLMGQTVYCYNGQTDALEIMLSGLESGVYTLNVLTHSGLVSKRIMVMK